MTDYSSLSCVSQGWISAALNNETLFTNAPPKWPNLPSALAARNEREVRARLFRRFRSDDLAQTLSDCRRTAPCKSGACPVCTRALQRHFVLQVAPLLQPSAEFVTLSIIPNSSVLLGGLSELSTSDFTGTIGQKLARSKMHFGVGGNRFHLQRRSWRQFPFALGSARLVTH